jgi:integrase
MNKVYNFGINNLLPERVGGKQKKWNILNNLGLNVECQSQDFGKDIVKQNYALENNFNRLNCPRKLITGEATFEDIFLHMTKRQRLTNERSRKLLTTAGTMSKHKYPVNFFNPDPDNFIQHMDYREEMEKVHPSVLKHEWNIMQKFLIAYGIEFGKGTNWYYKPPSIPPPKHRHLPLPDEMYKILHYNYTNDKLKNAFIKYSINFSTIFGWRNPSELCLQKISDIDLINGKITITEKKKHNKKRTIVPDYKEIINSKQIKSLKNWIEIWRPKITKNEEHDDFLFVRLTDGKPLTEMQYTRFIQYYVGKIFSKFKLYSTRHFCATGLLITEYLK